MNLAELKVAKVAERERDVLVLAALGQNNAEIAAQPATSVGTVNAHVSSVLAKLDAQELTEAVVPAYQSGLLTTGSRSRSPDQQVT